MKSSDRSVQGYVNNYLDFLKSQPGFSTSTCLAYEKDLRLFSEHLHQTLGHPPVLDEVNTGHVAGFLTREKKIGRRPNTLIRRLATLRNFSAFLQRIGVIATSLFDPKAEAVTSLLIKNSDDSRQNYLSDSEISRLTQAMEASHRPRARRDQAILALLLETGMSVGRIAALTLSDVQEKKGKINLRPIPRKEKWIQLQTASEPILRYLIEGRPELNPIPEQTTLFISQTGNGIDRQGIWQVLQYWGRATSLPFSLSPRLIRNTAIRRLSRANTPMAEIQTLLGHRNPLSTRALLRRLSQTNEN